MFFCVHASKNRMYMDTFSQVVSFVEWTSLQNEFVISTMQIVILLIILS